MTEPIRVGLSYMYEPSFNRALVPLLENGDVDALEWSFDTARDHRLLPQWMQGLLSAFAAEGRLYGHGVYYSLFSGSWSQRQRDWLSSLQDVLQSYAFVHLSEHFGFMTAANAHEGAPLPVPFCHATLALGIARLQQLQLATGLPIGLENLALSFSANDVAKQADFLRALVTPVGGFVLLDLHNVYCQAVNFGMDARALIAGYPLELVREIHVAGGSWQPSAHRNTDVRRDTHDAAVPDEVYQLLVYCIERCPNLELVILERLGDTICTAEEELHFRHEFLRVKEVVKGAKPAAKIQHVAGIPFFPQHPELENKTLALQQSAILNVLKNSADAAAAQQAMLNNALIDAALWGIDGWDTAMIETAMQLGDKWGISPV